MVVYWISSNCNGSISVNHFCSQCSVMHVWHVILLVSSTAVHSPYTDANSHILCGISSIISVSAMAPLHHGTSILSFMAHVWETFQVAGIILHSSTRDLFRT